MLKPCLQTLVSILAPSFPVSCSSLPPPSLAFLHGVHPFLPRLSDCLCNVHVEALVVTGGVDLEFECGLAGNPADPLLLITPLSRSTLPKPHSTAPPVEEWVERLHQTSMPQPDAFDSNRENHSPARVYPNPSLQKHGQPAIMTQSTSSRNLGGGGGGGRARESAGAEVEVEAAVERGARRHFDRSASMPRVTGKQGSERNLELLRRQYMITEAMPRNAIPPSL